MGWLPSAGSPPSVGAREAPGGAAWLAVARLLRLLTLPLATLLGALRLRAGAGGAARPSNW